jgi:hypothetical protein
LKFAKKSIGQKWTAWIEPEGESASYFDSGHRETLVEAFEGLKKDLECEI